jgi:hypothetical protein
MRPEDVTPGNFDQERIIFNNGDFSIAIGTWTDDETRRFAMRWNGDNDITQPSLGYPNIFGKPMWFQLPVEIGPIIRALIENSNLSAIPL